LFDDAVDLLLLLLRLIDSALFGGHDDEKTGLKLFGKTAFYVKAKDGSFKTFLRKPDADAYAATSGGTTVGFEEALASLST